MLGSAQIADAGCRYKVWVSASLGSAFANRLRETPGHLRVEFGYVTVSEIAELCRTLAVTCVERQLARVLMVLAGYSRTRKTPRCGLTAGTAARVGLLKAAIRLTAARAFSVARPAISPGRCP